MKNKGMMITVVSIAFIAIAAGSFWAGTYYQNQKMINQFRQFSGMRPNQQTGGMNPEQHQPGMMGGGLQGLMGLTGKVDSITPDSITMTTRMGSQKIEITTDIKVNKSASGSISDIDQGMEILVQGERDEEGRIQAESIQIITP